MVDVVEHAEVRGVDAAGDVDGLAGAIEQRAGVIDAHVYRLEDERDIRPRDLGDRLLVDLDELVELHLALPAAESGAASDDHPRGAEEVRDLDALVELAVELRVVPRRDHELRARLGELCGHLCAGLLQRRLERRQVLGRRGRVDSRRPPHLYGVESGRRGRAHAVVIVAGLGEEQFDVGCELVHGSSFWSEHRMVVGGMHGNLLKHVPVLDDPAALESVDVRNRGVGNAGP